MTRDRNLDDDAFSRFQPQERGRFGENEERERPKQITGKSDVIDVAGVLFHEAGKAILFGDTADRAKAVWLPKSLIEVVNDDITNRRFVTVTLPRRLAKEKGLI
jgi:hypothetical protein